MPPESAPRLPCRGCTPSCPNYDRCDGKPWLIRDGDSEETRARITQPEAGSVSAS